MDPVGRSLADEARMPEAASRAPGPATPGATFAVAMAVQVVFASQMAGLAVPSVVGLLLLAVWFGVSAGGTVWTVRRMDRRRARRQRGR